MAVGLLLAGVGVDPGWAVGGGGLATIIAAFAYSRYRSKMTAMQTIFPLTVDSIEEGELLRLATEKPVDDPRIPPAHWAMQRLNHARALTAVAMRDADHDRAVGALGLLEQVLRDPALDRDAALLAADDLVNAESLLAERSRDGARYRAAVERYGQLAGANASIPSARPRCHGHRATYLMFLAREYSEQYARAHDDGDIPRQEKVEREMIRVYELAENELRESRGQDHSLCGWRSDGQLRTSATTGMIRAVFCWYLANPGKRRDCSA
jgi:hypothetical protein